MATRAFPDGNFRSKILKIGTSLKKSGNQENRKFSMIGQDFYLITFHSLRCSFCPDLIENKDVNKITDIFIPNQILRAQIRTLEGSLVNWVVLFLTQNMLP